MADSAILLGLVSMKLRTVLVQPWLPQNMLFSETMAVVADTWTGIEAASDIVAFVAHRPVFLKVFMAVTAVRPICPCWNTAAVWIKMAFQAPRDILIPVTVDFMAFHTTFHCLGIRLKAVEQFCVDKIRIQPGLAMDLVVERSVCIFFGAAHSAADQREHHEEGQYIYMNMLIHDNACT